VISFAIWKAPGAPRGIQGEAEYNDTLVLPYDIKDGIMTNEKAIEIGRQFMWTENHRQRGPREHNDPPGYQSREALKVKMSRPTIGTGTFGRKMDYDELRAVNNIIVGKPDTVIKKLTEIIERLNPGYLHIYGNEGPMAHKDVMRSIELFGREVVPTLHELKLQPYA
jgi:alkanesulfonate monooxygenase SsuD/methylene tetrahydromethanopterin reductase-like flavin-dependent oxidoreductase (luciferase family)